MRWWGSRPPKAGVLLVAAAAALGLEGTIATHTAPGVLLGLCLVGGTVLAALAVRPGAVYLLIPVPPLAYLVAASVAGAFGGSVAGSSRSALAVNGAQWLASGFVAMTTASALAAVLALTRALRSRPRR